MNKLFVTETADELVYIAESDIMAFKELLAGTYYPADRKYHIICFHATQAVEKFLKGYIISNGKKIKRIHDLSLLHHAAMDIDSSFKTITDACLYLNTFTPDIRYKNSNPITKQNMVEIKKSLEAICTFQPIKAMRDSLSKKHKYEIVDSVNINPASNP
jgi:HEPN domain-containing protein